MGILRYVTDEHRNAITLSAMERWKKGRFKRTIKELSQFDNKKPGKLESEFGHSDVDNSYPNSPFKGQGWIGYTGTHVPMFVHKLGLIKPRQT